MFLFLTKIDWIWISDGQWFCHTLPTCYVLYSFLFIERMGGVFSFSFFGFDAEFDSDQVVRLMVA
jgi:hypothetical protein